MNKINNTFQLFLVFTSLLLLGCNSNKKSQNANPVVKDGMVFIEGGKFLMGGDNEEARSCLLYTSPSPRDPE